MHVCVPVCRMGDEAKQRRELASSSAPFFAATGYEGHVAPPATKRQKPDLKFPVRSYNKASKFKRLGGKLWQRAVMGTLGLETEERGPRAFSGAGRRATELVCSTRAWNKSLKDGGKGGESSQEQRGSQLSVGSCKSSWVSPVAKGEGFATGHGPPWTQSHLRWTYARPILSQGF